MQVAVRMGWLVSGVLLATVIGCGPRALDYTEAQVQGEVTYEGKPLENGLIRFVPDGEMVEGQIAGKPVFAKIENGKYALTADKGATVGKNRVEITSYRGTGRMLKMSGEGDETEQVAEEEQEQFIPARHNTDSTLLVEVKEGENTHDFALE